MEPLNLSTSQQFEIERFKRDIDNTANIEDLRKIAKELLQAFYSQKAITAWVMKDALSSPSSFYPPQPEGNDAG
jgi:hypothetical protein